MLVVVGGGLKMPAPASLIKALLTNVFTPRGHCVTEPITSQLNV